MGGTEAFPELGSHCNYEDCHLLDFLPFKCDCCNKTFCLDHRSYSAHQCPKAGMKDTIVLICPICATTVKKVFGENPDFTLGNHMAQGDCDPSNYDRVMKKPKCPVKRCREVLTSTNTYMCKTCKQKVCLKHRFPADHMCAGGLKPGSSVNNLARDFMKILSSRRGTECSTSTDDLGPKQIGSTPSKSLSAH